MLRIAICDDQIKQLNIIRAAVLQYFSEHLEFSADITEFTNSSELLDALEKFGGFDIALLDICMPGVSGTEIGRAIRGRHDSTEIIFITTSDEFAVEAFALKAAHYCLKPFTQEQFNAAMERAMERFIEKEPKKLVLQCENGSVHSINAESILYVESVLKSLQIHTQEAVFGENRRSLSALSSELEQLLPGLFISPYRGYIVNQKAIRTIMPDKIIVSTGESVPIKARDFRHIREAFFTWGFQGSGRQ